MMQRSYHFAGQHFASVGIYHVNNVWPAMMQRSYRVAGTHSANLGFHHFHANSNSSILVEGALDVLVSLVKAASLEQAQHMHSLVASHIQALMLQHQDAGILQSCCQYLKWGFCALFIVPHGQTPSDLSPPSPVCSIPRDLL